MNRKKFSMLLLVFATLFGIGAFSLWWLNDHPKDFTQTPAVLHKISGNPSKKMILVFFEKGCPYCRAGKPEIEKAISTTSLPVYFVDTEDSIGKQLVQIFELKYASTLVVLTETSAGDRSGVALGEKHFVFEKIAYADKINGKIVPLTSNIKRAFEEK